MYEKKESVQEENSCLYSFSYSNFLLFFIWDVCEGHNSKLMKADQIKVKKTHDLDHPIVPQHQQSVHEVHVSNATVASRPGWDYCQGCSLQSWRPFTGTVLELLQTKFELGRPFGR